MFLAEGAALFGGLAVDLALQGENGVDAFDCVHGDRRNRDRLVVAGRDIGEDEEFASGMSPAGRFGDRRRLAPRRVQPVEPGVSIGLENTAVMGQVPFGMNAGPVGREVIHRRRWIGAAEGGIVANISPQLGGDRLAFGQQRHRRVVAVKPFASEHMSSDPFCQWRQKGRGTADMIGQRRQGQVDAFAGKALALAVQRLMQGELVVQHHGQKVRADMAAGNHMERRRSFGDPLAIAAGKLLPDVLDDLPLPRDYLQGLGDVLANLGEPDRAAARACGRSRHDHPLSRQVFREWLLRGMTADRHIRPSRRLGGLLGGKFVLARRGFHVLQLQFHLVEQLVPALGTAAEKFAAELLDHQLLMGDQRFEAGLSGNGAGRFGGIPLGFEAGILFGGDGLIGLGFGRLKFDPCGRHKRLQRFDIIRQGQIGCTRHTRSEAQNAVVVGPNASPESPCRAAIVVEELSRHLRLVGALGMAPLDPFQRRLTGISLLVSLTNHRHR